MADSMTGHLRGQRPGRPTDGAQPELDLGKATWQSSSEGTGDVQIAFVEGYIAMRDGRNPSGPSLVFTPEEWRAFVVGARKGEFDLT
ncbi:hypothetical protein FHS38_001261 [Streptomyces netropsis]|uniref:DUF397 domain-containing protein n=2 Tax=Streptomyces netropsis TaxID=55404 RepID=A0A7W7L7S7_STRNE|nr:hypothetical protein [Streptomyces netropsis]GGR27679.1 hypothetical protein GCM10010219_35810 [Streptomyces netropsis]